MTRAMQVEVDSWDTGGGEWGWMEGEQERRKAGESPGIAFMRALQSITVWSGGAGSLTARR